MPEVHTPRAGLSGRCTREEADGTRLQASTTPANKARCCQAKIAWSDGDKYALDVLLEELTGDSVGVPGLLFEAFDLACDIADRCDPDARDHLRGALLRFQDPS